jgi:hypothetical protein
LHCIVYQNKPWLDQAGFENEFNFSYANCPTQLNTHQQTYNTKLMPSGGFLSKQKILVCISIERAYKEPASLNLQTAVEMCQFSTL